MFPHENSSSCFITTRVASNFFASAINFLTATQCLIPDYTFEQTADSKTYDFIIIGGGTAGSVVASRLSEISDWRVLLLEAGSKPPIESDIPYLATKLRGTKYTWNYYTHNDGMRHQSLRNGSVYWPRGKMLGGSSAINAMFYIRGREHDFRTWEQAGNPSWNPDNVKFYFRKAESYQNLKLLEDSAIRDVYGRDGPQIINTFNSTYGDLTEKVLDSWNNMDFKFVKDINAATYSGLGLSGIFAITAANGRRYSTYTSYLEPIKNRKNLNIVTNAFVTKILVNDDNEAYGVEVDISGEKKTFIASKEVIISAGSINTPQLLMLSGIGPKEHLMSKNIPCVVNLPGVGSNLHDHNTIPIIIYGDKSSQENNDTVLTELIKYMNNKPGLFSYYTTSDVTTLFSRSTNMEYPEFQSHLVITWKNVQPIESYFSIYRDDIIDSFVEHKKDKAMYLFYLHLLHPRSRGSVYLNTCNPFDHPLINANYFGDNEDLRKTVEGIRMLTKIVNTPYFKSINAFVPKVTIPECDQYEFDSDNYWNCYAISTCATVYHPVGTAKMGPDPKNAVVNNFLKVHGVKGLRVIDASVMPTITSGNTNAPTIMIGEMGSNMIKTEYLSQN